MGASQQKKQKAPFSSFFDTLSFLPLFLRFVVAALVVAFSKLVL